MKPILSLTSSIDGLKECGLDNSEIEQYQEILRGIFDCEMKESLTGFGIEIEIRARAVPEVLDLLPECPTQQDPRFSGLWNIIETVAEKSRDLAMREIVSRRISEKSRLRGKIYSHPLFPDVYIDGVAIDLNKSLKVKRLSPSGFAWGYYGTGAAQLALAILLELTSKSEAKRLLQDFKHDFISIIPKDKELILPLDAVESWLKQRQQSSADACSDRRKECQQ